MLYPNWKKYSNVISGLDPVKDHQQIVFLLACHVFPWDIERSLELGFFRTFAIPSISSLLAKTGEFKNRPQKRYDDTELIMYEIMENGYNSPRAKKAFKRLNAMHGAFNISNEDFLYVLSTFVFVPIYWIKKYGWRCLTDLEKLALFIFFQEVGKRMHIYNIPESIEKFESFHKKYELQKFIYSETNQEIGGYTRSLLLGFYLPRWMFPVGKPFIASFLDEPLLNAMGFSFPSQFIRKFVGSCMNIRKYLCKLLPEKNSPHLGTAVKRPTYSDGYTLEEIGTFPNKNETQNI